MSTLIEQHSVPWTAIPRAVLRDSRLSPAAKGGLVTLLSHDAGWVRSSIAILQRECRCGRAAAQSIMRELVATGYARLEKRQDDKGHLRSHYVVSSEARTSDIPVGGESDRRTDRPSEESAAVVEALDVDPLDVDPPAANLAPLRERDPIWDALVEVYGEPTDSSRGAWNRAAKVLRDFGADPDDIMAFYFNANGAGNDRFVVTPTALAKHFGSRQMLSHVPDKADHAAQLLREAMSE